MRLELTRKVVCVDVMVHGSGSEGGGVGPVQNGCKSKQNYIPSMYRVEVRVDR